jgi:TolB-like protein
MVHGDPEQSAYRLGEFTFDLRRGLLLREGKQTALRPKAQALLTHLARNSGRVVPKNELFDIVWPGVFVTEDSLTQTIRELRKALHDEAQQLIRTVARRGYLLSAHVEQPEVRSAEPVVAVLRFRNETGDTAQDVVVDGFAEDIIDGLARFKTVTVLAWQSSFSILQNSGAERAAAATGLGADFLVEGAIRRSQGRLKVSAALIDVQTLQQRWSDRYDAEVEKIFEVQQDIIERIIARLATHLEIEGAARARLKPPASLAAYELMLRGLALMRRDSRVDFKPAITLLERAIELDPGYGLAKAHLAFAKVMLADFGRARRADLDAALVVAADAARTSPDQPVVHRVLSFIQMYRREYDTAEHHLRQALNLNPYDAENVEQMGYLLALRGRPLEAIEWIDRAERLNPVHPPWYDHDRGLSLYCLGEYRAAAATFERTPVPPPHLCTWLAASYAQMGDLETARYHASRIADSERSYWAEDFARKNGAAFEHAADSQHFAEGVFLALGLPLDGVEIPGD